MVLCDPHHPRASENRTQNYKVTVTVGSGKESAFFFHQI